MKNYPLIKMNKEGTLLRPQHSYYSDEYTESMCDLFLRDCLVKDEQGKQHQYYRLHARQAHNMEMAFAYDIHCPDCTAVFEKIFCRGRCLHRPANTGIILLVRPLPVFPGFQTVCGERIVAVHHPYVSGTMWSSSPTKDVFSQNNVCGDRSLVAATCKSNYCIPRKFFAYFFSKK